MSGVALAAGAIAAAGAVGGAYYQSQATEEAAETQRETALDQMDVERQIFERRAALQQPFRRAGTQAMPRLQALATGQQPTLSPEEQAELEQLQQKQQQIEAGDLTKTVTERQLVGGRGRARSPQYVTVEKEVPVEEMPSQDLARLKALQQKQQRLEQIPTDQSATEMMGPEQRKYYNALAEQAQQGITPEQQQLLQQMEDPSARAEMGQELQEVYGQMREQTQQPLEESPYYQWRMGEQEEAINEAMAARGMQRSTPAVNQIADQRRALTGQMTQRRFNRLGQQSNLLNQLQQQNLGRLNQLYGIRQQEEAEQMQELGQMYNLAQGSRQNQFNRLANLANIGQGAAAQTGQAAGQFATGATSALQQAGAAQAQGAMRQGNIWGNAMGQIGAMPMRAYRTSMLQQAANNPQGNMSGSGTMQPWMFPNNRLTTGSGVMRNG